MLTVVLHLPKCGGTTFAANLIAHLGPRFFHYVAPAHDDAPLEAHIEAGFEGIDVVMVHNGKFPHHRLPQDRPKRYVAVVREPISAAVSLYNFAVSASHTRNYNKVKGLGFWQFWAATHDIEMWRPNFQTFYMTGHRSVGAAERFVEAHQVELYPMARMAEVYRSVSGHEMDPALDRNRAPFFHPVRDALKAEPVPAAAPERMIRRADLLPSDEALLAQMFRADAVLWARANAQAGDVLAATGAAEPSH